MIENTNTRNTSNLLASLTPTFANWTTNPGTNVEIVDELTNNNTTAGVSTATSTVTYDLGTSKRRIGYANTDIADGVIDFSDDGVNWYSNGGSLITPMLCFGKFRYFRFSAVNVQTYTIFKLRVYNI